MRIFRAELHVHTLLSPCAEVEMIPPLIVQEAIDRKIDLIAITDHNASANVSAVIEAAQDTGLVVLPGMEVQTQEEVHIVCLFDTLEQLAAWQAIVDGALPNLHNNPEYFGEQFVVDKTGDFIRREDQLLITSTMLSLEDVIATVKRLGGLAIPAHVNRQAFGLLANLGFVPPQAGIEALEISRHLDAVTAAQVHPQIRGYPLIQSGDAHRLDELLGKNRFMVAAPTIAEITLALHGLDGRSLTIQG